MPNSNQTRHEINDVSFDLTTYVRITYRSVLTLVADVERTWRGCVVCGGRVFGDGEAHGSAGPGARRSARSRPVHPEDRTSNRDRLSLDSRERRTREEAAAEVAAVIETVLRWRRRWARADEQDGAAMPR